MKQSKHHVPFAPLYLRAPRDLDDVLEEMAELERRTKAAVLSLALEEYAQHHHIELYKQYKEATS